MSYPIFMNLQQKHNLKQTQKLIMLPQMQQAIHLLQLPVMELSAIVESELEQNPLLDVVQEKLDNEETELLERDIEPEEEVLISDRDFEILKQLDEDFHDQFSELGLYGSKRTAEEERYKTFQETSICDEETLFEHLMHQAEETFDAPQLKIAEQLIGNFTENGFLQTSLQEIALLNDFEVSQLQTVLEEIKKFDPFGVGAANLQESFQIQLCCLEKKETWAYALVTECYEDLLHNRIPVIQKKLDCTLEELHTALEQIARLDMHPGLWFSKQVIQTIVPDITLIQEDDKLIAEVKDDILPSLKINSKYMRMLEDKNIPKETKDFLKHKIMSAKWFMRSLRQRNETLLRIAEFLAKTQKDFFLNVEGKLIPMTMQEVADELGLHESTIARAVSGKYIDSPKGVLSLRSFFTTGYVTEKGEDISSKTVQDVLQDIIEKEDKLRPLSDEAISRALKKKGIPCARRTVAKYRACLNIGNATQRKKF